MAIDDELRASQALRRKRVRAKEDDRDEREAARESYHAKEAAAATEIVAAFRRTLQLLVAGDGPPEEVQVWARPRIGPNRGLTRGWRIPNSATAAESPRWRRMLADSGDPREILLDTGQISLITPGLARRNASVPVDIVDWATARARAARSDPQVEIHWALYRNAFEKKQLDQSSMQEMEARLVSIPRALIDVSAQMLANAGVEL